MVSIPSVIHALHKFLLTFLYLAGVLYLMFSGVSIIKLFTFGAIVITLLILQCFMPVGLQYKNVSNTGTNHTNSVRANVLFGLGLALLFSWIPRIFVWFYSIVEYNDAIIVYLFFVSLPITLALWTMFVHRAADVYKIKYQNRTVFMVLITNTALFLASIPFAMIYHWYYAKVAIIFTHALFFLIGTVCMVDFVHVWSGNFEVIDLPVSTNVNSRKDVEPLVARFPKSTFEENDSRFECKICMSEFDDVKVPRMLKECGHSLCEGCADNLLEKSKGQHLFCPFCQKVTVVNGPASMLPKNFTIVDMIDDKKQKATKKSPV